MSTPSFQTLEVPVFSGGPYERGQQVAGHFTSARERLLKHLEEADNLHVSRNSRGRLRFLRDSLSNLEMPWCKGWEGAMEWAMEKLSFQDESGEATLSFDNDRVYISSGAIFRSDPPALLISDGPPSRGHWRLWQPDATDTDTPASSPEQL